MRREIHSNYRLVITPDMYLRGKHGIAQVLLDEMAAAVRRHVDYVGTVAIQWDTKAVCSHCGGEWETVTADDLASGDYDGFVLGEPVCCEQASVEFRAGLSETGGAS
ncbi:hypothetical protein SAMN05660976_08542 [Nonomuraea pusilla]|uniref:Uncharacterized protein n=2 Tax=Nonomuraea pusilla TaxID=46177 RepID=A0A1H8K7J1_9ACTN|nr:hypothetical protein SAMN05660976_08542 [Nonomuraea pusilla]